jgi:hypothetical protein
VREARKSVQGSRPRGPNAESVHEGGECGRERQGLFRPIDSNRIGLTALARKGPQWRGGGVHGVGGTWCHNQAELGMDVPVTAAKALRCSTSIDIYEKGTAVAWRPAPLGKTVVACSAG